MKEIYRRAPSAHLESLLLIKRRSKDAHLCSEQQVRNKIIIQNQHLPIDSWLIVLAQVNHSLYKTGSPENTELVLIMKKKMKDSLD